MEMLPTVLSKEKGKFLDWVALTNFSAQACFTKISGPAMLKGNKRGC